MGDCSNCKANCCSNVFKGLSEALISSNHRNGDFVLIRLSKEEEEEIIRNGFKQYINYTEDGVYLKLNEDNSCTAFKDGKCLIYNVRPVVCRLYPYYFDSFCGICIDKNCKGNFKLDDDAKRGAYKLLEKRLKDFKSFNNI